MRVENVGRPIRILGIITPLLIFLAVAWWSRPSFAESHLPARHATIESRGLAIELQCGANCLWQYRLADGQTAYKFAAPTFEVDGERTPGDVDRFRPSAPPVLLLNGVRDYRFEGTLRANTKLKLRIELQLNDETPVIRFRYSLITDGHVTLTKANGADDLVYFETSLTMQPMVREIRLSTFAELDHSYEISEYPLRSSFFADEQSVMGPIIAASDGRESRLLAYEHGSQSPDAFLQYKLSPDRHIRLVARKGNYLAGQPVTTGHPYTTLWFEAGAVHGGIDALASAYRRFVLKDMTLNSGTRQPFIFYNTWNFQERNRWIHHKPYLSSMNEERILQEIDVAHRMGIEVFVLDTGWYQKTGDWTVDHQRFPDRLRKVKAKLDGYGMRLGLWFGPTSAAVSSQVVRDHPEWRMSTNGVVAPPKEIWETEKSYRMCMVSGYADAFADQLIRLAKELGVTYFKWDAIGQYGCDDPHHNHGDASNSPLERGNSYAFQLVQSMSYVADKVAAAVPGAIVDFDVTEGGRAMGLGFLASGKYFLMNNGPYYQNYDVPIDEQNSNWNLFFHQGPARSWIARTPLDFDKWIPSVLFLTHYFPDDPRQWQQVSVASLILGQNGIWGDLPAVSEAGVDFIGSTLSKYKEVRADITESDPVVTGIVSGSPEIHEKLSSTSGRGAVVMFAALAGSYTYVTVNKTVAEHWASDGVTVSRDAEGRAQIDATFTQPGAKIIFFGAH
jgi:alpha-galactosidase